jgi:H+/Cl- antiporter ClcA
MIYLIIFAIIFAIFGIVELVTSEIKKRGKRTHIQVMLIDFTISIILGSISLVMHLLK